MVGLEVTVSYMVRMG